MEQRERRKFIAALTAAAGMSVTANALTIVENESFSCKVYDQWKTFQTKHKNDFPCAVVFLLDNGAGKEAIKLADTKNRKLKALISQLPLVFLPSNKAASHFKGDLKGKNMLLVDLKGKVLKSNFMQIGNLDDANTVYDELDKFSVKDGTLSKLWGKFVKTDDAFVTSLKKRLDIFINGGYRERSKARKEIRKDLKRSLPILFDLVDKSKNIEQRETCRDLLIEYSLGKQVFTGIPVKVHHDVRALCGMASMNKPSRDFLKAYTA